MEKRLRATLVNGTFQSVDPVDSRRMKAVRGRGNRTTEKRFRAALIRTGIQGWTLHPRGVVGSPDLYFARQKVAVFFDGCFWHGCPDCGHIPSKNRPFWSEKIRRNQERDEQKARWLIESGVRVIRFWEHQILSDLSGCVKQLVQLLHTRTG